MAIHCNLIKTVATGLLMITFINLKIIFSINHLIYKLSENSDTLWQKKTKKQSKIQRYSVDWLNRRKPANIHFSVIVACCYLSFWLVAKLKKGRSCVIALWVCQAAHARETDFNTWELHAGIVETVMNNEWWPTRRASEQDWLKPHSWVSDTAEDKWSGIGKARRAHQGLGQSCIRSCW